MHSPEYTIYGIECYLQIVSLDLFKDLFLGYTNGQQQTSTLKWADFDPYKDLNESDSNLYSGFEICEDKEIHKHF